jgi:hypothetical protein
VFERTRFHLVSIDDTLTRRNSAARGAKADHLKSSYASYGDRFVVVKITDIAHDKFPEALADVDGIIHIASPLPGRADPAEILAVCSSYIRFHLAI